MRTHLAFLAIYLGVLIWSAIQPHDYFTWFLEVIPGVIGLAILLATYKRFKFTPLLYFLMLIHCCILFYGGKYTYALNPLFDWIQAAFDLSRNNYDKLGHFAQGFTPTLIARELFIRLKVINNRKWLPLILVSIAMLISSLYELVEWWVAVLSGESAEAFLGTQGYVWDTQSDMLMALLGSIAALILLSRIHDRQIKRM